MYSFSNPDLESLSLKIDQAKMKQLSLRLADAQNELAQLKAKKQRTIDILVPALEIPSSYTAAIKSVVRRAFPELRK